MVARGEIGLLIIQIGLNNTPYMGEDAFITAVWSIVLNTIIGPVVVGLLVNSKATEIANGKWGLQTYDVARQNDEEAGEGVNVEAPSGVTTAAASRVDVDADGFETVHVDSLKNDSPRKSDREG